MTWYGRPSSRNRLPDTTKECAGCAAWLKAIEAVKINAANIAIELRAFFIGLSKFPSRGPSAFIAPCFELHAHCKPGRPRELKRLSSGGRREWQSRLRNDFIRIRMRACVREGCDFHRKQRGAWHRWVPSEQKLRGRSTNPSLARAHSATRVQLRLAPRIAMNKRIVRHVFAAADNGVTRREVAEFVTQCKCFREIAGESRLPITLFEKGSRAFDFSCRN